MANAYILSTPFTPTTEESPAPIAVFNHIGRAFADTFAMLYCERPAEKQDLSTEDGLLRVDGAGLVEADDTTDKRNSHYSRKNVCERLGVDYSTLTNVERGTISPTTFKLILYYYSLGYNPMWIIATDNEFIPKRNIGENLVYQEGIQENFKALESNILEALSGFKSKI